MRTIHKQILSISYLKTSIWAPIVKVLSVKEQYGSLTCWYEIDDTIPEKNVDIFIFGTGKDMSELPPNARYLDSVLMYSGSLVLHAYCVGG